MMLHLADCLQGLCGYGVALLKRNDGLVIQSVAFRPNEQQTACLKQHKDFLLAVLPENKPLPVGQVLAAVEAYTERLAIVQESNDTPPDDVEVIARQAALTALNPA